MSVGFSDFATIGTQLDQETPLALVHAASEADAERVSALVLDACKVSAKRPDERAVVIERLTANS
jgi:thymidine phosphorylase